LEEAIIDVSAGLKNVYYWTALADPMATAASYDGSLRSISPRIGRMKEKR
jgi:hypothetical protein